MIGGSEAAKNQFDHQATGFDLRYTGAANEAGDVPSRRPLESVADLRPRRGVSAAVPDDQITKGKVITAALA